MAWVRVDDSFYDHEKFATAGPLGIAQYMVGLAWCNRNLTDGFIPVTVARRLLDWDGIAWRGWMGEVMGGADDADGLEVSQHLVECGLWEDVPGGYQIHDYLDFQPSADDVRTQRAAAAEQRSAAGKASAAARSAKYGTAQPNGRPNETPNGTATEVRTRPEPQPHTQPQPSSTHLSLPPPPSSVTAKAEEDLVTAIKELRPEWSTRSIERALIDPDVQERPPELVRKAALAVARDPASQAPGRLKHDGPWWTAGKPQLSVVPKFCPTCAGTHLIGDDPCPDCAKGMTA